MSLSRKAVTRLNKLADLLDTVPRRQFNYGVWSQGQVDAKHPCGTQACALGWATTLPFAKREGLVLRGAHGTSCVQYGGDYFGRGAGMAAFDLTWDQAGYVFMPETDDDFSATPKQVAAKIRAFIKNGGAL